MDYIEERLTEIEDDMNQSVRNIYSKKKKGNNTTSVISKRKKRKELSKSATKSVNKHDVKVVVQFD